MASSVAITWSVPAETIVGITSFGKGRIFGCSVGGATPLQRHEGDHGHEQDGEGLHVGRRFVHRELRFLALQGEPGVVRGSSPSRWTRHSTTTGSRLAGMSKVQTPLPSDVAVAVRTMPPSTRHSPQGRSRLRCSGARWWFHRGYAGRVLEVIGQAREVGRYGLHLDGGHAGDAKERCAAAVLRPVDRGAAGTRRRRGAKRPFDGVRHDTGCHDDLGVILGAALAVRDDGPAVVLRRVIGAVTSERRKMPSTPVDVV